MEAVIELTSLYILYNYSLLDWEVSITLHIDILLYE